MINSLNVIFKCGILKRSDAIYLDIVCNRNYSLHTVYIQSIKCFYLLTCIASLIRTYHNLFLLCNSTSSLILAFKLFASSASVEPYDAEPIVLHDSQQPGILCKFLTQFLNRTWFFPVYDLNFVYYGSMRTFYINKQIKL